MLYKNNKISKDTYGINSNLIVNDIEAIKMRIELIFNQECQTIYFLSCNHFYILKMLFSFN